MKWLLLLLALAPMAFASESRFDPELAKRLGADERGMRMYVLCILKTGPKDAEIKGDQRKEIFAGHFANISRLANEGKLVVAGPFGDNNKNFRGLYIFNVPTIEEAGKLVELDPAVKAGVFVPDLTPLLMATLLESITPPQTEPSAIGASAGSGIVALAGVLRLTVNVFAPVTTLSLRRATLDRLVGLGWPGLSGSRTRRPTTHDQGELGRAYS